MKKTFCSYLALLIPVLLVCAAAAAVAAPLPQDRTPVTGTVVDTRGEPLVGALIMEKETRNGVITGIDGSFSLEVGPQAVLEVSYAGYETLEIAPSPRMTIVLQGIDMSLEEVVVIGYGVLKKKLVTGATVQVKGEDIARLNTPNAIGALQSQAPGVNITQVSGFIGDGYKVNIRGLGTNGTYAPLYVVDGIAGADLNGLSPNDIESIDILKDAATAAIYGSRAANGVVLVTTKTGRANHHEITYDGYYGWQNPYKIPTPLNAQEFMYIQDESRMMDGLSPYSWDNLLPPADLAAIRNGSWSGTNWLKEILNPNAQIQSHTVDITSGTDRSRSSIGFTYLRQEATMGVPTAVPALNRFNARINTESIIIKRGDLEILKIGQTLKYRYNQSQGQVARDDIYWNTLHSALIMSPLMYPYNSDGDYYLYADQENSGYNWDTANNANKNPIAYMDYLMNQNISKSHSLQSSAYAELKPIRGLTVRSQFGYLLSASSYRAYIPAYGNLTANLQQAQDQVTQSMSLSQYWTLDNTVSYVFDVNHHNFDVMVGQSAAHQVQGESMSGTNQNSIFYDFKHAWLTNVPNLSTIQSLTGSPTISSGSLSVFGRVNYNYRERYLLSMVFRADGSSNFAPGHRWGYFPSVSAGWVITNEDFWNDRLRSVNFLKLRASYGANGNDRVASFQYVGLISSDNNYGGYPWGNSMGDAATGSYAPRGVNPDLKWETQSMIDLGFEARFFDSRLRFEFDWYNRLTSGLLVTPPIPADVGVESPSINGGAVRNSGFEVVLGWNQQVNRDFYFDANLSLSYNKNRVVSLENGSGIINGPTSVLWEGSDECYRIQVGRPIAYFYGYASDGIFQNQAQIDAYTGAKLLGDNTQPGDVIWRDVNGDGEINADDRTEIGNPHPDFTLGFSFNISYKGFDLNVTTYGAFGHQILKCYRDFVASPQSNFTTDIFQRWHGEGTSNRYPRLSSSVSTNWNRISDLYIENGDFFKVKNLSIGYDFKRLLPRVPIAQLRLYLSAQNLFTITGYSGMDPEVGYGSTQSYAQGIDLGYFGGSRVFMIGTTIKF